MYSNRFATTILLGGTSMIYSPIETEGYRKLKANAMAFVNAMKVGDEPGAYKKEACENGPSTYGSYHATQVLSLFGELQKMPKKDLDAWAERIKALQIGGNGFFSNKDHVLNRCPFGHTFIEQKFCFTLVLTKYSLIPVHILPDMSQLMGNGFHCI